MARREQTGALDWVGRARSASFKDPWAPPLWDTPPAPRPPESWTWTRRPRIPANRPRKVIWSTLALGQDPGLADGRVRSEGVQEVGGHSRRLDWAGTPEEPRPRPGLWAEAPQSGREHPTRPAPPPPQSAGAPKCEALASPGLPAPSVEAEGCVDIRHLQWLMGKLRLQWRNLMASQQEQCALLGKIHSYTRGCHSDRSLGHLSVTETELLRDPEGGRQLLRRLEMENARLEAALEWRHRELIFWQWMDTVLDACSPEASPLTFLPRIPEPGPGAARLLARELQTLQEELREAAEARRAAWQAVVGGHGPEWRAARRALQTAVAQDLAALQRAWEQDEGRARPHGPRRLVRTEAKVPGGPGLWAAEATEALRAREACLEAVLRQLQGQCRQELARLAGARPGLIWVPPPAQRACALRAWSRPRLCPQEVVAAHRGAVGVPGPPGYVLIGTLPSAWGALAHAWGHQLVQAFVPVGGMPMVPLHWPLEHRPEPAAVYRLDPWAQILPPTPGLVWGSQTHVCPGASLASHPQTQPCRRWAHRAPLGGDSLH
ncbi:TPA: hCG2029376-like [Bos taurus]|nr:TPA: hCG2029376-like [Bos taurus]